jgi:hypothetical protein
VTRTRRHLGHGLGRLAVTALAAVLLAGAAGCEGDDSEQGQGDPTPHEPTSSTTGASSPSGTTGESSSPAAPSITPASGIQLTEASSAVRAPAGWKALKAIVEYASAATEPGKLNTVQLVDGGDLSGGAPLDVQAQSAMRALPKGARASRLADVMLDGVAAFHIHYTVPGDRQEYDTITTVRNGRNVGLDFMLDKKNAETNPDLVASVLATFQWIA